MSLISVEDALSRVLASVGAAARHRTRSARRLRRAHPRRGSSRPCATSRPSRPPPWTAMRCAAPTCSAVPVDARRSSAPALPGAGLPALSDPVEAVRIFTGAPLPDGADAIVIQENTESARRRSVTIKEATRPGPAHPPGGLGFQGRRCSCCRQDCASTRAPSRSPPPWATARCPSAASRALRSSPPATNWCRPATSRRPRPDRRVEPARPCWRWSRRPAREAIDLGIARDTPRVPRRAASQRARAAGADILVTLGGASVGEHDLVQQALSRQGMELGFWRVALRPGKPLMHGTLGAHDAARTARQSGLLHRLRDPVPGAGDPRASRAIPMPATTRPRRASSARTFRPNGDRQDYMRARSGVSDAGDHAATCRSRRRTRCRIRPCSACSRAPTRCSCGRLTRPRRRPENPAGSSGSSASADLFAAARA